MAGRPKKPTKLHILSGSAKKNPARIADRVNEPVCTTSVGCCPEWMPPIGKAEWTRCTDHPVIGQLISALHRGSFEHYCLLYSRFVDDATGERAMTASERQSYHSLVMQLGFTPASQSKVSMPPATAKENKWDKLDKMG